jgi:hypothetical protein
MDLILEVGVINSNKMEVTNQTILLDIGEPLAFTQLSPAEVLRRGTIFSIGGLIGELMLTLTCLLEYIISNPANTGFKFT